MIALQPKMGVNDCCYWEELFVRTLTRNAGGDDVFPLNYSWLRIIKRDKNDKWGHVTTTVVGYTCSWNPHGMAFHAEVADSDRRRTLSFPLGTSLAWKSVKTTYSLLNTPHFDVTIKSCTTGTALSIKLPFVRHDSGPVHDFGRVWRQTKNYWKWSPLTRFVENMKYLLTESEIRTGSCLAEVYLQTKRRGGEVCAKKIPKCKYFPEQTDQTTFIHLVIVIPCDTIKSLGFSQNEILRCALVPWWVSLP